MRSAAVDVSDSINKRCMGITRRAIGPEVRKPAAVAEDNSLAVLEVLEGSILAAVDRVPVHHILRHRSLPGKCQNQT